MNIVICGAGEVGRHAAEVLGGEGHNVTIIDHDPRKLAALEEVLDVRSLDGNGADAAVLIEAGCPDADLYIAATRIDEVNLLSASIAAGVGAQRTIARVHHSAFFEGKGLDYQLHLGIDHLVCPEYATAVAIAQSLRSPGALAVERFARGRIEIQQLSVSDDSKAIGKPLAMVAFPPGSRVAAIQRDGHGFIPDAATVIEKSDVVTLIGDVEVFDKARKLFHTEQDRRKSVVVMGGTAMAVWLARALRGRYFSLRIVEKDPRRAEELAEKLEWVTVLQSDPDDPDLFEQERFNQADAFIAVTEDDEHNILLSARAKSLGTPNVVCVLQRPTYLHLTTHVGIDKAYSPRFTAVNQIMQMLDEGPVKHLATLEVGIANIYEVHVPNGAASGVVGKPLKEVRFPQRSIIAAIQRGEEVRLPGGDDQIQGGDTVIVIGPSDFERPLRKAFGVR